MTNRQLGITESTVLQKRAPTLPTGWTYKGCYIDNAQGRILGYQFPDSQTLTVESCINSCIAQGYIVAGMEYAAQCFCGNGVVNGGALASSDTQCNMACSGNSQEMCGAGVSIFSHSSVDEVQKEMKLELTKRDDVSRTACRFIQKGHSKYFSHQLFKQLDSPGLGPIRAVLLKAQMPEFSSIRSSILPIPPQPRALPSAKILVSW